MTLNLRKTARVLVAGVAVASALTMTACSSDSDTPAKPTKSKAAAAEEAPPGLTVEALNAELKKALDPSIPIAQKLDSVQGISADPNLPDKLAKAQADNKFTIKITGVSYDGKVNGVPTGTATADASLNGGAPQQATVPFVYEDSKWKIEHSWACNGLANAKIPSSACTQ